MLIPNRDWSLAYTTAAYGQITIVARDIDDETAYAAVMHELGHALSAWGMLRTEKTKLNWNLILEEERAAWDWARHYALDWTTAMASVERCAMLSYGQNC